MVPASAGWTKGTLETFQVVVAVERPVRRDFVAARAGRIGNERHGHALACGSDQVFEGKGPVEAGEQQRVQLAQADARQVVRRRRKIADALEFRHPEETPVEREAATVVPAAEVLRDGGFGADQVSPVVVQTLESARSAPAPSAREQQGLVDTSFQEREKAAPIPAPRARSAPSTSCQLRANTRSRMTLKRAGSRYQAAGSVRARRMSSSITAHRVTTFARRLRHG